MKETELTLIPKGFKTWGVAEDFIQKTSMGKIVVPKGFETNLASTPRFMWIILPPFGRYSKAAVVHDYLYYSHKLTRKESDKVFYELMLRYDTYPWKAKLMFYGVRLFGGFAW